MSYVLGIRDGLLNVYLVKNVTIQPEGNGV
jgi:hypothetical protein